MPLLKGYFIFNDTIQTFEVNIEYLLRSLRYLKTNFAYLERLLLYLQQHRTKIKLKIQIHPKYEYLRKDILDIVAGNYIADNISSHFGYNDNRKSKILNFDRKSMIC
jgi:hypothetical protein